MTDGDGPAALGCGPLVESSGYPDERCLEAAAPHVLHDLELLQLAWEGRTTRVGWTLWFILARSLDDFFFQFERRKRRDGYQDDVLAADFLPLSKWETVAKSLEPPPDYKSVRTAANKLAAHLTYSRIDAEGDRRAPPSPAAHDFLLQVASAWFDVMPASRRAWFGQGLPGPRPAS